MNKYNIVIETDEKLLNGDLEQIKKAIGEILSYNGISYFKIGEVKNE